LSIVSIIQPAAAIQPMIGMDADQTLQDHLAEPTGS
jgi:hypothetical protein